MAAFVKNFVGAVNHGVERIVDFAKRTVQQKNVAAFGAGVAFLLQSVTGRSKFFNDQTMLDAFNSTVLLGDGDEVALSKEQAEKLLTGLEVGTWVMFRSQTKSDDYYVVYKNQNGGFDLYGGEALPRDEASHFYACQGCFAYKEEAKDVLKNGEEVVVKQGTGKDATLFAVTVNRDGQLFTSKSAAESSVSQSGINCAIYAAGGKRGAIINDGVHGRAEVGFGKRKAFKGSAGSGNKNFYPLFAIKVAIAGSAKDAASHSETPLRGSVYRVIREAQVKAAKELGLEGFSGLYEFKHNADDIIPTAGEESKKVLKRPYTFYASTTVSGSGSESRLYYSKSGKDNIQEVTVSRYCKGYYEPHHASLFMKSHLRTLDDFIVFQWIHTEHKTLYFPYWLTVEVGGTAYAMMKVQGDQVLLMECANPGKVTSKPVDEVKSNLDEGNPLSGYLSDERDFRMFLDPKVIHMQKVNNTGVEVDTYGGGYDDGSAVNLYGD